MTCEAYVPMNEGTDGRDCGKPSIATADGPVRVCAEHAPYFSECGLVYDPGHAPRTPPDGGDNEGGTRA